MKKFMIYLPMSNTVLLFFLILTSCSRKEDDLIAITTSGRNTMGVTIDKNYNVMGCKDIRCIFYCSGVSSYYRYGNLTVRGLFNDNFEIYLKAKIDSSYKIGDTLFFDKNNYITHAGIEYKGSKFESFTTDSMHKGFVVLTSLSEYVSSGTFQFESISPNTQSIKSIKNGRFDINCE